MVTISGLKNSTYLFQNIKSNAHYIFLSYKPNPQRKKVAGIGPNSPTGNDVAKNKSLNLQDKFA